MPLAAALNIAQKALLNTARQTSVVSRNVSESGNADYARRRAMLESTAPGASVASVQRSVDSRLFRLNLDAISSGSAQSELASRVDQLEALLAGQGGETALTARLQDLQDALQTASADPSNTLLLSLAANSAKDLASSLAGASQTLRTFREDADQAIDTDVARLNALLRDFGDANSEIVTARATAADANDAYDRRDALLKQIAEITPVTVRTRANDDMVLSTSGGTILFETVPRTVTFEPTVPLVAGTAGGQVRVDGVPLAAGAGAQTSARGSLSALLQLRDTVAPQIQNQLDEIARGLISAFSESDQSGSGQPNLAGLFRSSAYGSAVPPDGVLVTGLADTIEVNPAFDADAGGDPALLRDAGANGSAYVWNASAGAGYADRLIALAKGFDTTSTFDATAGLSTSASLGGFAAAAEGWLEGFRSDAAGAADEKAALQARLTESLSNATGVNVDEEMTLLLQLEHSYEASARLIQTINNMLATVLEAVH